MVADVNNESNPHFIDSPYFTGHILVRVKDFAGVSAKGGPGHQADSYFGAKKRKFAIQIAGRFKQAHTINIELFI